MNGAPRVSVVVPVHEDPAGLDRCLRALRCQDVAPETFEIIVCDNGSTTAPASAARVESAALPRTVLISTSTPGSYRARNTCLGRAAGDVVAFTDADCAPQREWLRRGLEALEDTGADLVAGRVEVYAQHQPPTPTELFEVLTAFPQERYVAAHGFGVTANLFVRRELFDRVGPFSEALMSGGDREFGERAGRAGARIAYADDAVVRHPARATVGELATKTRRVVRGALDAGHAPPTRRQWLRQAVPPLGAPRRALAFSTWRDRAGYVRGEVGAHYLRWWSWRAAARQLGPGGARGPATLPVVLSNTVVVQSNPWLALWLEASREAGLDVRGLTLRGVLARGADRPVGAHLQWPERALNPASTRLAARNLARLLVVCSILRARGARLLLTAHNTASHDQGHPVLERVMWAVLPGLVTDVHAFSLAGRAEVERSHAALARRRWHEIPHGDYGDVLGSAPSRREARQRLGVDPVAPLAMTVGALRGYKGASDLLHAFTGVEDRTATLLLRGQAPAGEERELRRLAARDPRVRLDVGRVSDDDLHAALAAADLVVLPYRRVLNSGSAVLALSARRRVLIPSTATFEELARRVGPAWVTTYKGHLSPGVLAAALAAPSPEGQPDLAWCSWEHVPPALGRLWGVAS